MNYKDFNIEVMPGNTEIIFKGKTVNVRSWLPTAMKVEFIQFVVSHAMNPDYGTFSPVITDAFETIAYIKYFTDIEFTDEDLSDPGKLADEINYSGLRESVRNVVEFGDKSEWLSISLTLDDTIANIERYNASFAGTMSAMNGNATELGNQLDTIIEKIKNKEGIEELTAIREFMDKTE